MVAWNCLEKFDRNLLHLLDLDPDLAVVSESQPLTTWPMTPTGRTLTQQTRAALPGSPKHLTVLAVEPWTVDAHPAADTAPPWALPVQVTGPVDFLAVGLCPVQQPGRPGYVGQIAQALDWLDQHHDGQPVVMAGDFNAPISTSAAAFQRLQPRFAALGLVDAFQHVRPGQQQAAPTFYWNLREDQPFHIDHICLPKDWTDGLSVSVGDFHTWVGSRRSDHAPVTAVTRSTSSCWRSGSAHHAR
jgi:exodeoxyribonuclease-3